MDVYRFVLQQKRAKKSLRWIAKNCFGGRVNHAVIARILKKKFPEDPVIRYALGLPAMRPAPVCPRCGRVHVRRSCPDAPRHYRDFLSMPKTLIVQMFENREEIK